MSAIKQKTEGIPYRTIAKNLDVNYRNVYEWIKKYKDSGMDGIRNKRKNGGRKPVISSDRNKEMVKDIVLNKSPQTFGYLKYLEYQTFSYISFLTIENECQSDADMMEDNSGFRYCIQTAKT